MDRGNEYPLFFQLDAAGFRLATLPAQKAGSFYFAAIVQMVEHRISNPSVAGSTPVGCSTCFAKQALLYLPPSRQVWLSLTQRSDGTVSRANYMQADNAAHLVLQDAWFDSGSLRERSERVAGAILCERYRPCLRPAHSAEGAIDFCKRQRRSFQSYQPFCKGRDRGLWL